LCGTRIPEPSDQQLEGVGEAGRDEQSAGGQRIDQDAGDDLFARAIRQEDDVGISRSKRNVELRFSELQPDQFAETLGLISTTLGAAAGP